MENPGLYLLALAMIFLMPGPDMILLLQTGASQGRAPALATAVGLAIARGCHVALAAMGLATLFKVAPWTFDVVRIAGAAYLLWMGGTCSNRARSPHWPAPANSFKQRPCDRRFNGVC